MSMDTGMQQPSILPLGGKQSKEIEGAEARNHNIQTTHAVQQTNHPFLPPDLGRPEAVLTLLLKDSSVPCAAVVPFLFLVGAFLGVGARATGVAGASAFLFLLGVWVTGGASSSPLASSAS